MPESKEFKVNQLVAALIVTSGAIGVGTVSSWSATALPSLEETGQVGLITNTEKAWIGSLASVGAMVSSLATPKLMNLLGRRGALLLIAGIALIPGYLLMTLASAPGHIYGGRFLTGLYVGGICTVVPVYVREISSQKNRGLLGSFFLLMWSLGKLYTIGLGILLTAQVTSILCAIIPMVFAFALMFIPESPIFLRGKGRLEEARSSLNWLNTTGLSVPYPCFTSAPDSSYTEEDPPSSSPPTDHKPLAEPLLNYFKKPEILKPTLTTLVLMMLTQVSGVVVITFYTVEIFQMIGDSIISPKLATLGLTTVQTVGCLAASSFVDKYGRRVLFLSSFLAMGITMGGLAAYFYLKAKFPEVLLQYPEIGVLPFIFVIVFYMAYSWGSGNIVFVTVSELLPPEVLETASSLGTIFYWGGAFGSSQIFQMYRNSMPFYMWFVIFSGISLFGVLFIFAFLPETKNLSLREIQGFYIPKIRKSGGSK